MEISIPRIMVAALRGGSGKTFLSLGLASAWIHEGKRVAPFKKGPDFIDPGWLTLAAGRTCHNLDPFMMNQARILESFLQYSHQADVALIESNRGLFDGLDMEGRCSSAELARSLGAPVLLIVDVTMTTRTIAAVVMGCRTFDPGLDLRGVVLNRVGGSRQESLVRNCVEHYCGLPVVGSIRKLGENRFPERHMGLIPHQERSRAEEAVSWACRVIRENLNLEALWNIVQKAPKMDMSIREPLEEINVPARLPGPGPRIGFVLDSAFWFYYPENLSALRNEGAELIKIKAIQDARLPDLDGLYIGGGFPETQAESLTANRTFRSELLEKIQGGLPVYAECGGLMYMGENLVINNKPYPMVGALPVDFVLEGKPQGHGYTVLQVSGENPFYEPGTVIRGHEFHYSKPVFRSTKDISAVFKVKRGRGLNGEWDGLCRGNLLALYTHIHAAGTPSWAGGFVRKANEYRRICRTGISQDFQKGD